MIGRKVSHYEILEQVGRGGMGVVYKAQDLRLKRVVALKFLPAGFDELDRARFVREAQALARLDRHENICTVYDIDEVESDGEQQTFIAMQYLEGRSVKELLAGGALETEEALRLTNQVGQGLSYAHREGILHRDIKPANVIVGDDGGASIVDFGLAVIRGIAPDEEETRAELTTQGTTLGTVDYMSPEQAAGSDVDQRTDVWSLGVMTYEMLTGEKPFVGSSTIAVLYAIANEQPKPIESLRPELPRNVVDAVRHALEKSPGDRYSSVDEMLRDLEGTYQSSKHSAKVREVESAPSIAILPFVDMSREQDQAYLCEGIAEEIINELMQVEGLRTVARGSSFKFSGKAYDVAEIRKSLQVDSILNGSVRSSADRLRITLQLIDAARDVQVWSQRFDRESVDVFELQDEIAQAVADQLQVSLGLGTRDDSGRRHSANVEAYHLYLKGRYYWNRRLPDDMRKAIEQYRAALDIDPTYALAHVGLADAFMFPGYFCIRPPHQVFPLARASVTTALELDPDLPEAHATLAMVSSVYEFDWAAGARYFGTALSQNAGGSTAEMWYALFHLVALGKTGAAVSHSRRAQHMDPLTPSVNLGVGACLFFNRDYDDAVRELERAVELEPNFPSYGFWLGKAYWEAGRGEEAIESIRRDLDLLYLPIAAGQLGYFYARSGQTEKALEILDSFDRPPENTYIPAASRAPLYIGLGENELALDWLEKALEEHSPYLVWIGADPVYDEVRDNPRFQSILARMNLG